MEMLLLRVENTYSLRFPNRTVPDSRVFASVYNKLRETVHFPEVIFLLNLQTNKMWMKKKGFFSRYNVVQQQAHEKFLHISVFHIQEKYSEIYVSMACILFIYRWCYALKEMKVDDWIFIGG